MLGDVVRAGRAATPALAVLLAVVAWRDVSFSPVPGLDPSWHAGLHMAAHHRMAFGDGLVFTFGPLGFLTQPTAYYTSTGLLSAAYVLVVQSALCASLVSVLRRGVGLVAALAATYVVAAAGREVKVAELVTVVVVVTAFGLLRGDHGPVTERALVVAGGVVAGTHLLVKFNTGLIVAVVAVVTAWFVGRRTWRSEVELAATALASLVAGWMATGNALDDLPAFFAHSWEVASGYSQIQGIELTERDGFYAAAAGVTLLLLALGWMASRGWPRNRRLGLALVGAVGLFAGLKHGFVRHDQHDLQFFGQALVVGTALAGAAAAGLGGVRKAVPAVAAVALLVVYALAAQLVVAQALDPVRSVRAAGGDVRTFASPGRRSGAVDAARAELRRAYGLQPAILALLAGRTVHVRPWETQLVWAYPELRWRPLPVFQEYSAYTAALDRLDAELLAGPDAPERIVTEEKSVDARNPDWESPAAVVALVCHYRELAVQHRWQVLRHAGNRCGAEEPLGVVEAVVGETVAVPSSGGRDVLVLARIRGLDASPLYALRSALLRLPPVQIFLDGDRPHRLVPGTAGNGLVVRAPSAALGFSEPFALASASSLRIEHGGGWGLGSRFKIEFVAVPVVN